MKTKMKISLAILLLFLVQSNLQAQELLRKGETYVNHETSVFIFTRIQALQVIEWERDAKLYYPVLQSLVKCDSIAEIRIEKIRVYQEYIQELEAEVIQPRPTFFNRVERYIYFAAGLATGYLAAKVGR